MATQIPEVRSPDIILILQPQELDDTHGDAAEQHIFFCSLQGLYDPLLLMAVLYLCEWVSTAFSVVTVQSGDCMCPDMVTKTPKLLFQLPEHGLNFKTAGICSYDVSRSHGQIRTCQDGLCLSILYKDKLHGLVQSLSPQYILERKRTSITVP